MARLIYSVIASLDGYIADQEGNFDWAVPDDEVHTFINDLERPIRTYLYGRRMYEVMAGWETDPTLADQSPVMKDFARVWQAAEKVVYSTTLERPSTARTRIERDFDPEAVRQMKASAGADISVGGPDLAGHAITAGLVDEYHLFVAPIVVGGGTQALPDGVRVELELVDERRFASGVVYLRYRVRAQVPPTAAPTAPRAQQPDLPILRPAEPPPLTPALRDRRGSPSPLSVRSAAGSGSRSSRVGRQVDLARLSPGATPDAARRGPGHRGRR